MVCFIFSFFLKRKSIEESIVGWTDWFALLGNSVYYDYNMSDNGLLVSHGSNYSLDYFTDLVGNQYVINND